MSESETHSEQLTQINEALVSWEGEKIRTANQIENLKWQQQQLIGELYEIAIAEQALYRQSTSDQAVAQARITELETALAAKTDMATQMLSELETEATETFNQFNAKIEAQNQLIQALRQQIETLRKTNTVHPDNHPKNYLEEGRFSRREANNLAGNLANNLSKNPSDSRFFGRQKMSRAS